MQDRRTMIQVALRTVLGTVVGLIVAFILILGVEAFGGVVHPIPEGFDGSTEAMCRHVERFPGWVLAAVVPMWGLTALVGTWLARRVGTLYAAGIVGLLLTAAVVVWAIYTVGLAWRPSGVDPMLMLAALTVIGLAALAPAYAWEISQGRSISVHLGSLASLAYVGIFPGFLGYVFYNRGVAEVGANKASLFIHLMPVFGTLLSAIFLAEVPQWYHYVGIALIFSGIWMTTRKA